MPMTTQDDEVGTPGAEKKNHRRVLLLSLAALGVVFGDIGTSPLYAIRECFHGEYGLPVTGENILGVLSLVFWSLVVVVTVKYLGFILRADNEGEGGVIALTALIRPVEELKKKGISLVPVGLFAAALLYGDGMITPAISVLSAVEGIRIVTPVFEPFVIPLTIVILAGLFLIQRRGTASVGRLFGPVIFVWFVVLALLGVVEVVRAPEVFSALLPWHAVKFFLVNRGHGFVVLGAVFLVVTGAEALYADLGHFGKRPIRLAWLCVAFPALLLNYFGQGALLLAHPEHSHHPFYSMVPSWGMIPMVLLATSATVIASQAVISGAFSLTKQAIQLGYLPRLRVTHTSATHPGQIYIAPVNWMLMVCTIGLVVGFQSSSKLAAAYGVAVTSTMLIAAILFYAVARKRWQWSPLKAGVPVALFLLVDLSFFSANVTKIFHGAWFPLAIGGVFFTAMLTWDRGRKILHGQIKELNPTFRRMRTDLEDTEHRRVSGQGVFLTGSSDRVPAAFVQNLRHNRALHGETVFLHIVAANVPRVPNLEKVAVEQKGSGFYWITARYGFMEEPRVENLLTLAQAQGLPSKMDDPSFFLGREQLEVGEETEMARWRSVLFVLMSRNAMDAATFFGLPIDRVLEVGVRLRI